MSYGQQDFPAGFHLCGRSAKLLEGPELLSRIFQESCWRNIEPNNTFLIFLIANITNKNLSGC